MYFCHCTPPLDVFSILSPQGTARREVFLQTVSSGAAGPTCFQQGEKCKNLMYHKCLCQEIFIRDKTARWEAVITRHSLCAGKI